MLCTLYELHHQFESIEDLTVKEYSFIRQFWCLNNHVKFLVMFLKMGLYSRKAFILFLHTYIYLALHSDHLLVKGISSEQVFFQSSISPLTKHDTPFGIDTKAHRYNRVQVVIGQRSIDHSITFFSNCSEIPNGCFLFKFPLVIYISNMLTHVSLT